MIYERSDSLQINDKLKDLNATFKGDYWIVCCPTCGHKEAFIYLDDVEKAKENPKYKIPIRCNRLNKCGAKNYLEDIQIEEIPKISTQDIIGISENAIIKINSLAKLNHLLIGFDMDWRGISNNTLKQNGIIYLRKGLIDFMKSCGKNAFDEKFFLKRCYQDRDLIIPIQDYDGNCQRLLLRSTKTLDDNMHKEISMRLYKKTSEVWNRKDLIDPEIHCIFATEGVPDGLSIKEVSQNIGVISLPGVKKYKQIFKEIDTHKNELKDKKIIIAFDNDDAGKKYMEKFQEGLEERNIPFETFNLCGYKDMNEFLQADRTLFFEEVEKAAGIYKPKKKMLKTKKLKKPLNNKDRTAQSPAEELMKKVGPLYEKKKLVIRTCKSTV